MPYREVRIYDRDFPGAIRVTPGDPRVKNDPPRRVWKQAMDRGDFAVVFRQLDYPDRFLMPDGKNGLSSKAPQYAWSSTTWRKPAVTAGSW
jgi:hypothetical protein